jgi:hypothetical protein
MTVLAEFLGCCGSFEFKSFFDSYFDLVGIN